MTSLVIGLLAIAAGVGWLVRRAVPRRGGAAAIDDDAIREIERTGRLAGRDPEDDAPLDLDAIDAAEREFWAEAWDEPEEYGR